MESALDLAPLSGGSSRIASTRIHSTGTISMEPTEDGKPNENRKVVDGLLDSMRPLQPSLSSKKTRKDGTPKQEKPDKPATEVGLPSSIFHMTCPSPCRPTS